MTSAHGWLVMPAIDLELRAVDQNLCSPCGLSMQLLISEALASEVKQYHFYQIPLVKGNHRASPGSRGVKIYSTS